MYTYIHESIPEKLGIPRNTGEYPWIRPYCSRFDTAHDAWNA